MLNISALFPALSSRTPEPILPVHNGHTSNNHSSSGIPVNRAQNPVVTPDQVGPGSDVSSASRFSFLTRPFLSRKTGQPVNIKPLVHADATPSSAEDSESPKPEESIDDQLMKLRNDIIRTKVTREVNLGDAAKAYRMLYSATPTTSLEKKKELEEDAVKLYAAALGANWHDMEEGWAAASRISRLRASTLSFMAVLPSLITAIGQKSAHPLTYSATYCAIQSLYTLFISQGVSAWTQAYSVALGDLARNDITNRCPEVSKAPSLAEIEKKFKVALARLEEAQKVWSNIRNGRTGETISPAEEDALTDVLKALQAVEDVSSQYTVRGDTNRIHYLGQYMQSRGKVLKYFGNLVAGWVGVSKGTGYQIGGQILSTALQMFIQYSYAQTDEIAKQKQAFLATLRSGGLLKKESRRKLPKDITADDIDEKEFRKQIRTTQDVRLAQVKEIYEYSRKLKEQEIAMKLKMNPTDWIAMTDLQAEMAKPLTEKEVKEYGELKDKAKSALTIEDSQRLEQLSLLRATLLLLNSEGLDKAAWDDLNESIGGDLPKLINFEMKKEKSLSVSEWSRVRALRKREKEFKNDETEFTELARREKELDGPQKKRLEKLEKMAGESLTPLQVKTLVQLRGEKVRIEKDNDTRMRLLQKEKDHQSNSWEPDLEQHEVVELSRLKAIEPSDRKKLADLQDLEELHTKWPKSLDEEEWKEQIELRKRNPRLTPEESKRKNELSKKIETGDAAEWERLKARIPHSLSLVDWSEYEEIHATLNKSPGKSREFQELLKGITERRQQPCVTNTDAMPEVMWPHEEEYSRLRAKAQASCSLADWDRLEALNKSKRPALSDPESKETSGPLKRGMASLRRQAKNNETAYETRKLPLGQRNKSEQDEKADLQKRSEVSLQRDEAIKLEIFRVREQNQLLLEQGKEIELTVEQRNEIEELVRARKGIDKDTKKEITELEEELHRIRADEEALQKKDWTNISDQNKPILRDALKVTEELAKPGAPWGPTWGKVRNSPEWSTAKQTAITKLGQEFLNQMAQAFGGLQMVVPNDKFILLASGFIRVYGDYQRAYNDPHYATSFLAKLGLQVVSLSVLAYSQWPARNLLAVGGNEFDRNDKLAYWSGVLGPILSGVLINGKIHSRNVDKERMASGDDPLVGLAAWGQRAKYKRLAVVSGEAIVALPKQGAIAGRATELNAIATRWIADLEPEKQAKIQRELNQSNQQLKSALSKQEADSLSLLFEAGKEVARLVSGTLALIKDEFGERALVDSRISLQASMDEIERGINVAGTQGGREGVETIQNIVTELQGDWNARVSNLRNDEHLKPRINEIDAELNKKIAKIWATALGKIGKDSERTTSPAKRETLSDDMTQDLLERGELNMSQMTPFAEETASPSMSGEESQKSDQSMPGVANVLARSELPKAPKQVAARRGQPNTASKGEHPARSIGSPMPRATTPSEKKNIPGLYGARKPTGFPSREANGATLTPLQEFKEKVAAEANGMTANSFYRFGDLYRKQSVTGFGSKTASWIDIFKAAKEVRALIRTLESLKVDDGGPAGKDSGFNLMAAFERGMDAARKKGEQAALDYVVAQRDALHVLGDLYRKRGVRGFEVAMGSGIEIAKAAHRARELIRALESLKLDLGGPAGKDSDCDLMAAFERGMAAARNKGEQAALDYAVAQRDAVWKGWSDISSRLSTENDPAARIKEIDKLRQQVMGLQVKVPAIFRQTDVSKKTDESEASESQVNETDFEDAFSLSVALEENDGKPITAAEHRPPPDNALLVEEQDKEHSEKDILIEQQKAVAQITIEAHDLLDHLLGEEAAKRVVSDVDVLEDEWRARFNKAVEDAGEDRGLKYLLKAIDTGRKEDLEALSKKNVIDPLSTETARASGLRIEDGAHASSQGAATGSGIRQVAVHSTEKEAEGAAPKSRPATFDDLSTEEKPEDSGLTASQTAQDAGAKSNEAQILLRNASSTEVTAASEPSKVATADSGLTAPKTKNKSRFASKVIGAKKMGQLINRTLPFGQSKAAVSDSSVTLKSSKPPYHEKQVGNYCLLHAFNNAIHSITGVEGAVSPKNWQAHLIASGTGEVNGLADIQAVLKYKQDGIPEFKQIMIRQDEFGAYASALNQQRNCIIFYRGWLTREQEKQNNHVGHFITLVWHQSKVYEVDSTKQDLKPVDNVADYLDAKMKEYGMDRLHLLVPATEKDPLESATEKDPLEPATEKDPLIRRGNTLNGVGSGRIEKAVLLLAHVYPDRQENLLKELADYVEENKIQLDRIDAVVLADFLYQDGAGAESKEVQIYWPKASTTGAVTSRQRQTDGAGGMTDVFFQGLQAELKAQGVTKAILSINTAPFFFLVERGEDGRYTITDTSQGDTCRFEDLCTEKREAFMALKERNEIQLLCTEKRPSPKAVMQHSGKGGVQSTILAGVSSGQKATPDSLPGSPLDAPDEVNKKLDKQMPEFGAMALAKSATPLLQVNESKGEKSALPPLPPNVMNDGSGAARADDLKARAGNSGKNDQMSTSKGDRLGGLGRRLSVKLQGFKRENASVEKAESLKLKDNRLVSLGRRLSAKFHVFKKKSAPDVPPKDIEISTGKRESLILEDAQVGGTDRGVSGNFQVLGSDQPIASASQQSGNSHVVESSSSAPHLDGQGEQKIAATDSANSAGVGDAFQARSNSSGMFNVGVSETSQESDNEILEIEAEVSDESAPPEIQARAGSSEESALPQEGVMDNGDEGATSDDLHADAQADNTSSESAASSTNERKASSNEHITAATALELVAAKANALARENAFKELLNKEELKEEPKDELSRKLGLLKDVQFDGSAGSLSENLHVFKKESGGKPIRSTVALFRNLHGSFTENGVTEAILSIDVAPFFYFLKKTENKEGEDTGEYTISDFTQETPSQYDDLIMTSFDASGTFGETPAKFAEQDEVLVNKLDKTLEKLAAQDEIHVLFVNKEQQTTTSEVKRKETESDSLEEPDESELEYLPRDDSEK